MDNFEQGGNTVRAACLDAYESWLKDPLIQLALTLLPVSPSVHALIKESLLKMTYASGYVDGSNAAYREVENLCNETLAEMKDEEKCV